MISAVLLTCQGDERGTAGTTREAPALQECWVLSQAQSGQGKIRSVVRSQASTTAKLAELGTVLPSPQPEVSGRGAYFRG